MWILIKTFQSIVIIACTLVSLEVVYRVGIHFKALEQTPRDWDFYVNIYTGDKFKCSYFETLESHPYLGWITGPFEPCARTMRNNRGFWDRRDIPWSRDPNYFTILVTGGSVASQFSRGSPDDSKPVYWLDDELNSRFKSPNGKPFRVLSGAMGVWRMPTQIIAATLFGNSVDAIVSLDGYNEMQSVIASKPLDMPEPWTWFAVLHQNESVAIITKMKFMKAARILISTSFLRNSKSLFAIYETIMSSLTTSTGSVGYQTRNLSYQFSVPETWGSEQLHAYNVRKWQNYLQTLRGVSSGLSLKYAHFIQPIPTLGKILTTDELKHSQFVTAERYISTIVRPAEALAKNGFPIKSLTQVFENVRETIYADEIHPSYSPFDESLGYKLIARSMAQSLGEMWNLRKLDRE